MVVIRAAEKVGLGRVSACRRGATLSPATAAGLG